MIFTLWHSLASICDQLTYPVALAAVLAILWSLRRGSWRKRAIGCSLALTVVFLCGWRIVLPLVSGRYFAILILPAIFLTVDFLGDKIQKKWIARGLWSIVIVLMLGKALRFTSNDDVYFQLASDIRHDMKSYRRPLLAVFSNDGKKFDYTLRDSDIEILDFSFLAENPQAHAADASKLVQQLQLQYDVIYLADKKQLELPADAAGKSFGSTLCRYRAGKKSSKELIIYKLAENRRIPEQQFRRLLSPDLEAVNGSFLKPMPEAQQTRICRRLVQQGFVQFQQQDIHFPQGWIPEVYSESTGKEQVFYGLDADGGLWIKTPNRFAMVMEKRLSVTEDFFAVAVVSVQTPVRLLLGSYNYDDRDGRFEGAFLHGLIPLAPGEGQLVVFRLDRESVAGKEIHLRWIVAGGSIKIHHLYFFPCRLWYDQKDNGRE